MGIGRVVWGRQAAKPSRAKPSQASKRFDRVGANNNDDDDDDDDGYQLGPGQIQHS